MQIKLENVSFKYNNSYALKNINFELQDGITVILGHNGSGKSTLLNILNLVYTPVLGKIYVEGREILKKEKKKYLKKISTVYQFSDMQLFNLTIEQDLLYSVKLNKLDINRAKKDIKKYFEEFNLNINLLNKSPFRISGGEKKKIAIISSLLLEPEILILDEPTIGLDYKSKEEILKVLKKLSQKIKIIVVLHDFNIIQDIADNIVELSEGRLINNLSKGEFFDLKYKNDSFDSLSDLYKIFKYLKLEKKEYDKYVLEEKLLNFIKDKYGVY